MNENKQKTIVRLKEMYEQNLEIKTVNGEDFEVPKEGSLGLLALGYRGIIAWRKAKGYKPDLEKLNEDE